MLYRVGKYPLLFGIGAAGYGGLEVLWRGFTHWTMCLCGGICLILLYILGLAMAGKNIVSKCAAGAAVITTVEFTAGCLVNIVFELNVWSYADVPGNLMGQICLPFMLVWFALCFPVFFVFALLEKRKNNPASERLT